MAEIYIKKSFGASAYFRHKTKGEKQRQTERGDKKREPSGSLS